MVDFVYFLTNLQQTIEIFHDLSPRNITAATLPPPRQPPKVDMTSMSICDAFLKRVG